MLMLDYLRNVAFNCMDFNNRRVRHDTRRTTHQEPWRADEACRTAWVPKEGRGAARAELDLSRHPEQGKAVAP